ncbi:MAG: NADPH-dependent F420 reductase [Anaerolineae bacterium]|nr:NADPH-dependent F420 reductase [Anaerolineae bacterium]
MGGTGKEGSGLAARWARSGYRVIIGSREAAKAEAKVAEMNAELGSAVLVGADNLSAVQQADIVVLTVPYDAHARTLEGLKDALQGKVVVDVTVPLKPPAVRTVNIPPGQSACMEAQALLGSGVKVVAAFQNVSNTHLQDDEEHVDCDVLVCGDDAQAKEDVIQLAVAAGMRGIDAGPLQNAIAIESLTPVILYINRKYKVKGAGIVITGLEQGKA